jgi:hypothetical protein
MPAVLGFSILREQLDNEIIPTIRLIAVVSASRVLKGHVRAAKKPHEVLDLVGRRVATKPVREAFIVRIAACRMPPLSDGSMIARKSSPRSSAVP